MLYDLWLRLKFLSIDMKEDNDNDNNEAGIWQ